MEMYDLSTLATETDVIRVRLQMRARALELIRQMVAVRREDWHLYLTKYDIQFDPGVSAEDRAEYAAGFRELALKHRKIRRDISDTIRLVRDLDRDSYGGIGSLPEH